MRITLQLTVMGGQLNCKGSMEPEHVIALYLSLSTLKELAMNDANNAQTGKWTTRLLFTGIALLIIGLATGQASLSPFVAMLSITVGCLLAIIAAVIVLIGVIRNRNIASLSAIGWTALIIGAASLYSAGGMVGGGGAPIHDISTDTQNPPAFIVVATLRGENDNPAEYLDDGTAEKQAEAYPDIKTIVLQQSPSDVYIAALDAADAMGWEIVASEPLEGRIEATATTPFVGFKDDVVIRIVAVGPDTLVDIRSKSRIGRGDMGVNAARIREFRAILTGS